MKIKNASPQGKLDVPLLGRRVERDEVVDVTPDQASRLLGQSIWEPADQAAENVVAKLTAKPSAEGAEKPQEPSSKVDAPSTGENITKPGVAPVAPSGDEQE